MANEVVGASQLELIEAALVERFGSAPGPASIARVLADHGARLSHPEILQADARWRGQQLLFTPEELDVSNLEAAIALINKIELLRQKFENDTTMAERLRQTVRQFKSDLDSLARSPRTAQKKRQLTHEVAQWLSVWLQNPQIFAEWLNLRQNTAEFRERYLS
ncbi:MAG TPA: hypothetical protein VGQ41_07445 [Pyrinomonadaceae bacterium]|jgi:hypothetical protein|nr:hypothetical protein [Pyrinomonadaceae bacterium]